MRLVFIDECGDANKKDYLGLSIASVDSKYYPLLKRRAQSVLLKIGWEANTEFKGSYLFSVSKGCPNVSVEDRVAAATALLDLNTSEKNSRMKFTYGRLRSTKQGEAYLRRLPGLLHRGLVVAPKGAGKNLLAITCDERSDLDRRAVHSALTSVVQTKGYVLHESVTFAQSSFDTIGLMFADLVGYLAARVDLLSADAQLFEGLSPQELAKDGQYRKLTASRDLLDKVKKLTLYTSQDMD